MKIIRLLVLNILVLMPFSKCYTQDTVSFSSNTNVVLNHFSNLFPSEKKVVLVNSCIDEDNNFYYKIHIIDKLSFAIRPEPMYYLKYKNIILVSRNYSYYVYHSTSFLEKYVEDIKAYVDNNVIIDSFAPLKYHLVSIDKEIVVDEKILYYYYKVNNGNIISFENSFIPTLMPCEENHSFK